MNKGFAHLVFIFLAAIIFLLVGITLLTNSNSNSLAARKPRPTPSPSSSPLPSPNPAYNPVVLVHGLCLIGNTNCENGLNTMRDWFKAQGYQTYIAPIPSNDNVENAQFLVGYIDNILSSTGKQKVHLVGHSMGPASMLHYVKFLGGTNKISTFMALESGTVGNDGACGLLIQLGGQTCPTDPFWIALFSGEDTPGSASYVQIRADGSVGSWPPEKIEADKYDGGSWWNMMPGDHLSVVTDTNVFQMMKSAFEGNPTGTFVDKPIN